MNKTAELVRLWAVYEEGHPTATLDDFYRYMMMGDQEPQHKAEFLGGNIPPDIHSTAAKLIGRIASFHFGYAQSALKDLGINNFDDFMYMSTIHNAKNPRKTEVIYKNFSELSSGLLIIDRLKKAQWVEEQNDLEDKRSKRLSLTPLGTDILFLCYGKMVKACKLFYGAIAPEDLKLCVQLLSPLDLRFAPLWADHKNNTFEENYKMIMENRGEDSSNPKGKFNC